MNKEMTFDDVLRAMDWDLKASLLEEKMNQSVLTCICKFILNNNRWDKETKKALEWAFLEGANVQWLNESSGLLFELTRIDGIHELWSLCFKYGYSADKVEASQINAQGFCEKRITSKLILLCNTPYCYSTDLNLLIRILVEKGVDVNERDSEGWTALGRLNDQLKRLEEESIAGSKVAQEWIDILILGMQELLSKGALIEGLLPTVDSFAAKSIKPLIKSYQEKEKLESIRIPTENPFDAQKHLFPIKRL